MCPHLPLIGVLLVQMIVYLGSVSPFENRVAKIPHNRQGDLVGDAAVLPIIVRLKATVINQVGQEEREQYH